MHECPKCNSNKLSILTRELRIDLQSKKWVLVTPLKKFKIDDHYKLYCHDCYEQYELNLYKNTIKLKHYPKKEYAKFFENNEFEIFYPKITQTKVVFDLDETLMTINQWKDEEPDFIMQDNEYPSITSRSYFRNKCFDLIKYVRENFKDVEVCTASLRHYAEQKVKHLGIDDLPLKTVEDLGHSERTVMAWDREFLKKYDNAIVIDDRPQVVTGWNNIILTPDGWTGYPGDEDLSRVIEFLKNGPKEDKVNIPMEYPVVLENWTFAEGAFSVELQDKVSLKNFDKLEEILQEESCFQNENDEEKWVHHKFKDGKWIVDISIGKKDSLNSLYEKLEKAGFYLKNKVTDKEFKELKKKHEQYIKDRFNF